MYDKSLSVVLFEKLCELYGGESTSPVSERYRNEMTYWNDSQYKEEFEIFCELLMLMNATNRKYDLIGTAEHSFLLHLLGITKMNPL